MKLFTVTFLGVIFSLKAFSSPYFFATCTPFDPTFSPQYHIQLGTLATPSGQFPERVILITKIDHDFETGKQTETRTFGTAIENNINPASEWTLTWNSENQTSQSLWIKKLPNGVIKGKYNTGNSLKELVCTFRSPWK